MSVNYIKNIMFQKTNYLEIYKSYLSLDIYQNDKVSINANKSLYFYLIIDKETNILKFVETLFNLELDYSLTVSMCKIIFGYNNSIYTSETGILTIVVNHPYLEGNKPIIIGSFVDYDILERSYAFYTYIAKPFKQLTVMKIKRYCEYDYLTHNIESRGDLLKIIRSNNPKYTFSISKYKKRNKLYMEDLPRADEISLILIRTINEMINEKENEIIEKCKDVLFDYFIIKAKEILSRYLSMGDFSHNFILVERLFLYEPLFKKEIENYLNDRVLISICRYKKITDNYTKRYNAISNDEDILAMNSFVVLQLEKFIDCLEEK